MTLDEYAEGAPSSPTRQPSQPTHPMAVPTLRGHGDYPDRVEGAIRERFAEWDHAPSEGHWEGLRAVIETIDRMARGKEPPRYSLSPLPTGIGKTSALIQAVRELVRIGEEDGEPVGVLVLTNTLDQIPPLIEAMGLEEHQYAVRVGKSQKNEHLNARGMGDDYENAQVLFTTQQKLYAQTSLGLILGTMHNFKYRGHPRRVRVWDECILPAEPRVLAADDIERLKSPLMKAGFKAQRDNLEALATAMKERKVGEALDVPYLALPDPDAHPEVYDERDLWVVDALTRMAEGRARIRQDGYSGSVALYYEEILPHDLPPLLVLDASGKLRQVYQMWRHGERGNLRELPSADKTYHNLRIRHWDQKAGQNAHRNVKERRRLAEGAAEAVADAEPGSEVLVIHRLPKKPSQDMETAIEEAIERRFISEDREPPVVHYRTWGRHLATNEFKHIEHLIVVGLLQYNLPQAEAMARGSGGLPAESEFSDKEVDLFHRGEIAHHLFQAVGRGKVRYAKEGDCPPGCRLDIIFKSSHGYGAVSQSILADAFPGATIEDWEPLPKPLTGNRRKLVEALMPVAWEDGEATRDDLAERIGCSPLTVWRKLREETAVARELARRGYLVEWTGAAEDPVRVERSASLRPHPATLDRVVTAQRPDKLRHRRR